MTIHDDVLHQLPATVPRSAATTIHEAVERQVGRSPQAVAVSADGVRMTYAELDARASGLAARLREHGVGPESRVAVTVPRSADFVVAALGVLKAGAAYVPVDPAYPPQRQQFMLADAGVQAVLGAAAPDGALPVLTVEGAAGPARAGTATPAGALAYVIYTSGSTGTPKGVAIPHSAVLNLLDDPRLAVEPGDVVAHLAPTAFDASTCEIWAPLTRGGRIAVLDGATSSAAELAAALRQHRPDWLFLTTGLFHLLVDADPDAFSSVGVLLTGGDVLSPRHVRTAARTVRDRVYAAYGPTETTVFAALHAVPAEPPAVPAEPAYVPLGTAIAGTALHVLDDALEPARVGGEGEIHLGGAGVGRGYHDRPGLTADRFVPDHLSGRPGARLYRTGDRGRRRPGGEVEFLGRVDRQVKLRGFRIELGEVEAALSLCDGVAAAAVTVARDRSGARLVAFAVAAGQAELSTAELRAWLAGRLPPYMLPTNYVLLDTLPLDPNGKVDRRRLPAPWTSRDDLAHRHLPPYVAPEGRAQELVADAFVDALVIDRVGADDNFFELGGDSLRAVRMLEQLRANGIEVSARQFFRSPTVALLARTVDADADAGRR